MAFNLNSFQQWKTYMSSWGSPVNLDHIYDYAGYIYGGSNLDVDEASIPSSWLGTAGDRRYPAADTLEMGITGTAYDGSAYDKVIKYTWAGLTVNGGGNNDIFITPSHIKDAGGAYVATSADEQAMYRIRISNGPTYAMLTIEPNFPSTGPQPGPFSPGTAVSINTMVFDADNYDALANSGQAHNYVSDYTGGPQTISVVKITESGEDATLAGQDVGDTLSVYGSAGWLATPSGQTRKYQWNLDGVAVAGVTGTSYTTDTAGTVTVTVSDDEFVTSSTSDGVSVNAGAQGAFVLDEDFESTDVGSLPSGFTTSGDAGWEVVANGGAYEGTKHLISQDIDDSQASVLVYSLTITEAAVLNFWWNVSSEANYDKLHFYVDGAEEGSGISGAPGWAKVTYTFNAAGTYELKWSYTKDSSADGGDDLGMLDKITVQNINEDTTGGNIMSKTRINIRQVDLELAGGAEEYETMAEAVAAEGAALYGKLVPAKFDPKYMGVSLSVVDFKAAASGYTIVNRDALDDVRTTLEGADTTLQSNIDAEAARALAAEAALQGNIDAEAAARTTADTTLQSNIDAEAARALAAEAALQGNIDTVDARVTAILSGSSDGLDTFIEVVAAYEAADGSLETSITNLSTVAADDRAAIRSEFEAADTALQGNIDALGAYAGVEILSASDDRALIRTEFAAADVVLQNQITSNDTDIATNAADISSEAARALAAEAALSASVTTEQTRALTAEAALTTDVSELNADILALYGRHFRASSVVGSDGTYEVALGDLADEGSLQVFVNGILMVTTVDYTVSSAAGVMTVSVLGCETGDDVTVMGQKQVSLTS
jgi:hypothetical protein